MSTRYVTAAVDIDLTDFEFSKRSEPIDYQVIKDNAIKILGKELAVKWGISSNLEGLAPKEGKYVKMKDGSRIYSKHVIEILSAQDGHISYETAESRSKAKEMGKDVVTIQRLARAFAADTIKYLERNPSYELATGLNIAGLSKKFQFLNSPYGMVDKDIKDNFDGLVKMYTKWNKTMSDATSEGWNKPRNGERKDYVKQFVDYCEFRGVMIE